MEVEQPPSLFRVRRVSWLQLPFGLGLAVVGSFFADGVEADFAARLGRWRDEFADGVEERFDRLVVAFEAAFPASLLGKLEKQREIVEKARMHRQSLEWLEKAVRAQQERVALILNRLWESKPCPRAPRPAFSKTKPDRWT